MRKEIMMLVGMAIFMSCMNIDAAGVKYSDGDKYVKIGGRMQLQYYREDPESGSTTDDLMLRRLRPYIEGSVHKDWAGKFQWDMGKGSIKLQDVYMRYLGFDDIDLFIGNTDFIFSREFLTSNKYQTMVERTFVGSSNYGSPHRQTGVHVRKHMAEKKVLLAGALTVAAFDPDNKKLDWESAIQLDAGDDWSEGVMVGARAEWNPMGAVKWSQGDFDRGESKVSMAVAGFYWQNDDDNISAIEVDSVTGESILGKQDLDNCAAAELDCAYRGYGVSIDAEYNIFEIDLVQKGVTDGLYKDSSSTLTSYSVEAGYMLVASRFELGTAYQSQDADGYADSWDRISVAANYYVKKHDIKYQLTYRMNENKDGVTGKDVDETFLQAQYVF